VIISFFATHWVFFSPYFYFCSFYWIHDEILSDYYVFHELTYAFKSEVVSLNGFWPDETIDDQVAVFDWGWQPRGTLDSLERDAKPRGHTRRVHGTARDWANASS